MPILSLTLWLPVAAAVIVALIPRDSVNAIKGAGLLAAVATFVVSLGIVAGFQDGYAGYQLVERWQWIPQWGISYSLGIDGISLWLVLLTTLLTPLIFLSQWDAVKKHPKEYFISFLIMETALIAAFLSTDLLFFYTSFDPMLWPMYLVIGVWGGANRIYAAIKFFLFTIAGSLLMLLAILYLAFQYAHQNPLAPPTFDVLTLYGTHVGGTSAVLMFFAFALAFAIK